MKAAMGGTGRVDETLGAERLVCSPLQVRGARHDVGGGDVREILAGRGALQRMLGVRRTQRLAQELHGELKNTISAPAIEWF